MKVGKNSNHLFGTSRDFYNSLGDLTFCVWDPVCRLDPKMDKLSSLAPPITISQRLANKFGLDVVSTIASDFPHALGVTPGLIDFRFSTRLQSESALDTEYVSTSQLFTRFHCDHFQQSFIFSTGCTCAVNR